MKGVNNEKSNIDSLHYLRILFLAFGLSGFYGFILMKGTFYNILKSTLMLNDFQLSTIWGVYGFIGIFAYILGGYLADKISSKKILVTTLTVSAILHFIVSLVPGYQVILIASSLMALTAVFAFFPSSTRAIGHLTKGDNRGRTFGFYYATEAILSLVVNFVGSRIYSLSDSNSLTFVWVMRIFVVINLIGAIGILLTFPKMKREKIETKSYFKKALLIFKDKRIIITSLIILSDYAISGLGTYFAPYLTDVFGYSDNFAIIFSIIRFNIISVFAGILIGKLSDKLGSVVNTIIKLMPFVTILLVLIFINDITLKSGVIVIILSATLTFLTTGIKSVSLAMLQEFDYKEEIMGLIIGVTAFIAYSPDAYIYLIAGKLLVSYGNGGYKFIFLISLALSIFAIILAKTLLRYKDGKVKGIKD